MVTKAFMTECRIRRMSCSEILRTPLQKRTSIDITRKRSMMINEALSWRSGTKDRPKRYDVGKSGSDRVVAYFLKPGKEVFRTKSPNPNDMTPVVGNIEQRYSFRDMWVPLGATSLLGREPFQKMLVLVYRNAFLLDHVVTDGRVRYRPSSDIRRCIDELEREVREVLPCSLLEFLYMFDILGWNEDVKYHSEDGKATFEGKRKVEVGRLNNMLTGIHATHRVAEFVDHVIDKSGDKEAIDLGLIFSAMQAFVRGRGVAPPSDKDLVDWLAPYLVREG